ncbi:WUSCHEL-related homeobox 9-like [Cucurbita pepo subsp. pepo]|uniref:WUSCHEL-related homeobox 9-like n=1 Tax=Cucurbita pepo subsp. pepo TaxID=3664 RepID=UPI000C9D7B8E|nr:WUSCHEL-related homeobox 9-like [Cucurbita pepo subsp. pepo]
MASSNSHWPSMFKSKPCNSHHQWQHDINCLRSAPYNTVVGGYEEKSPDPKPRWNPKPEQIRILEAIFNSGMVNPPRDEIRKIRGQLQEYGQVGDANVFYWFQNRKSRSKNKLRHLHNSKSNHNSPTTTTTAAAAAPTTTTTKTTTLSPTAANPTNPTNPAATCSSSSSSDKSSPKISPMKSFTSNSVSQSYLQQPTNELLPESFFFPMPQTGDGGGVISNLGQGFCFSELCSVVQHVPDHGFESCTNLLLSESDPFKKDLMKSQPQPQPQFMNYHPYLDISTDQSLPQTTISTAIPQGVGEVYGVGGKSTVFINGVAFEVGCGPFNVREAFGDDAVLIHSTGQPVLTNDWGLTLHSLQHGAYYYLI